MHFYRQTEDLQILPFHFVPMTSRPDELRPTRVNDVRKLWKEGEIVCPSVTTVLNVLDKAALNNWKIDRHLEQAWMIREKNLLWEEWIPEVKRLTELQMEIAPKAGTDIHKSLELYADKQIPEDHADYDLCNRVFYAIYEEIGVQLEEWTPEQNFISDHGYGGQVDLHNEDWVIDFKSKQTADKFKQGRMVYQDHSMQLAAYREGLRIPQARCANVFVCLETGEVDFHEHTQEQLETGWQMFYHALKLWQIQNGAPRQSA